jgi:hypothetical protein
MTTPVRCRTVCALSTRCSEAVYVVVWLLASFGSRGRESKKAIAVQFGRACYCLAYVWTGYIHVGACRVSGACRYFVSESLGVKEPGDKQEMKLT